MSNPEEEQLYRDLWDLISKLASEPELKSHARAQSLIAQNCQALEYPQSVDLFIELAKSDLPRLLEAEEVLFMLNISHVIQIHRCCGEHQDSDRQIKIELLIEQLKEDASKRGDIEDELSQLDALKFLKDTREAREERESATVPESTARQTETSVTDLSMPRVESGDADFFDLKYELQSFKFKMERLRDEFSNSHDLIAENVEHLNERTNARFADLISRIDDKLSNRSLAIAIAVTGIIAVVAILIGILVIA